MSVSITDFWITLLIRVWQWMPSCRARVRKRCRSALGEADIDTLALGSHSACRIAQFRKKHRSSDRSKVSVQGLLTAINLRASQDHHGSMSVDAVTCPLRSDAFVRSPLRAAGRCQGRRWPGAASPGNGYRRSWNSSAVSLKGGETKATPMPGPMAPALATTRTSPNQPISNRSRKSSRR